MTSLVENIAFDCADPYELAQFWSRVTGQPLSDEDFPPEAGRHRLGCTRRP